MIRSRALEGRKHAVGRWVGIALVLLLVTVVPLLLLSRGRFGLGKAPRPPAEQVELLARGNCALGVDGKVLGRVAGRLRLGYWIEEVDRKRIFRVGHTEIRIVPCASLPR